MSNLSKKELLGDTAKVSTNKTQ